MRWSDSTHGERLKSHRACLNLAKKPGDAIWGYFSRLVVQTMPIRLAPNTPGQGQGIAETLR